MILTPLGIAAAYSTGPYGYACTLIDKKILLDVSPQAMTALNKLRVTVDSLEAIVLSHFDPDHILGFPLLIPARTPEAGRLPVYGPSGVAEHLSSLTSFVGYGHKLDRVEFRELSRSGGEEFTIGEYRFRTWSMLHEAESLGYVVTSSEGRSLAYSGDTAWCDSLSEIISLADASVVEMSEFERTQHNHLFLRTDLQNVLRAAGAEAKIYLTHLGRHREEYIKELRTLSKSMDEDLKARLQNVTILDEFLDYKI